MADARQRTEWNRWSVMMAHVANCNPFRKSKKAFKASDFDPFNPRVQTPIVVPLEELKGVFDGSPKV